MLPDGLPNVQAVHLVLACSRLQATLSFFTERLGFRVDAVHPAHDPSVAVISGHGLHLRLERGADAPPCVLRLLCRDPGALAAGETELTAPNGTRIEIVASDPPLALAPLRPSFVLSKASSAAPGIEGRAGMRYRDLIPDRQGGRFIASLIQIQEGGPVPDYVHFHRVRFQMIYCAKGWVRVVYEDQGPPFVLREGDCVLQPPTIRHRVLESSPGLEVIEIGSPADHETLADHDLPLPTPSLRPNRESYGQRFLRHEASTAAWRSSGPAGWETRDFGIEGATGGMAGARVVRSCGVPLALPCRHDAELLFFYVLGGSATLHCGDRGGDRVLEGDAFVIPPESPCEINACSDGLELLEVSMPPLARGGLDRAV